MRRFFDRMHVIRNRMLSALPGCLILPAAFGIAVLLMLPVAQAQITDDSPVMIVPQSRTAGIPRPGGVTVTKVDATISIREQSASTTIDFHLTNSGTRSLEAKLVFPIQSHVVVKGMSFSGLKGEGVAQIMEKDDARKIYDAIVARMRDPALLEFIGHNLIQTSAFPIEPGKTEIVTLAWEELLPVVGDRLEYMLLRSESIEYRTPWHVTATIQSPRGISTVYSPGHELIVTRRAPNAVDVEIDSASRRNPGMFRLTCLFADTDLPATFHAYPEAKTGGGYFLLLAGLPLKSVHRVPSSAVKREVTLVLDRSGSMRGEKIEHVREAALQILSGLEDGEFFNIVVYNESIDAFETQPVMKTAETMRSATQYIENITVRGGTNIHDALLEAFRQTPVPNALPIVLFLTDGLPTVGNTTEKAIRNLVTTANPHNRRVFTFGVGVDVNAPLLERLALDSRAASTFVLPGEDVEVKVGQVFNRLAGPVLTRPEIQVTHVARGDVSFDGRHNSATGSFARGAVMDMIPDTLPDMFDGDQLIILGRYTGDRPLRFIVTGDYFGEPKEFRFDFDPANASARNAFVARLWAARKIAVLTDAVRQLGGDDAYHQPGRPTPNDPRVRELVEEIVRLSTEFGILTEYTSFLATDGEASLPPPAVAFDMAEETLRSRGMRERSGIGAVSQSINADTRRGQKTLNYRNEYRNDTMQQASADSVQQVNDLAFYRNKNVWTDSRVVNRNNPLPSRTVVFGSEAYQEILNQLILENRQGALAMNGDILLDVAGELILVRNP
jgi:Ca-activated chloride channel homolog